MIDPSLPEGAETFLKYIAVLESIAVQRELEAKAREVEYAELLKQMQDLTGACNTMAAMLSALNSQLVYVGLVREPDLREHRSLS